ncbi:exopolysaccharide biosynthesis polyprenyl glycosylphosphotransferase [Leptolyngbya sp. AN03gr2]|uniref:exopolysaccharide biosynthesis polyprenyl glycosylphosphotransferase n=1 Tax=Leptolyngbya sp. AN03gr2 TaxID=3423364 RepID=UPI003D3131C8
MTIGGYRSNVSDISFETSEAFEDEGRTHAIALPMASRGCTDPAVSDAAPQEAVVLPLRNLFDFESVHEMDRFSPLPGHRSAKLFYRCELAILITGAYLPALFVWAMLDRAPFTGAFVETSLAIFASVTLAWHALCQLRGHSNARDISYVLPVNFGAFTSVVTFLALARIPYSGSLLASGAVFGVASSFALAVFSRRLVQPHVIISGGRASEIPIGGQYVPAPNADKLEQLIDSGWRDWAIVADLHYPHSDNLERLFAKASLAGIPVYHFRTIAETLSGQVKITHLSENEFGSLIPHIPYMTLKRMLDVVAALILIPICLPLFGVVALIIRVDSPGKAFFIQERIGFRGKRFKMIKFRTMRERLTVADDHSQRIDAMTKTDDDRITGIGRLLRKTRLDELPQIFNVLRGEMSLIGPRPEACALSEWYQTELPFYSYRHIVRPGITGWAQVNQGHVTDVSDVLSKLRYDFYYIKNISLWLDALIALKTLRVMVTGTGAK